MKESSRIVSIVSPVTEGSFVSAFFIILLIFFLPAVGLSQQAPDPENVFEEDSKNAKKVRDKMLEGVTRSDGADEELDFEAPEVQYKQETKTMVGSGGVVVSRGGVQLQADTAEANIETKDVTLSGDVVFTWPEGEVISDTATVNLDTETGEFREASVETIDGSYRVSADELFKDSEREFRFNSPAFTTCYCDDDSVPWSIECSRAYLEDDGYAQTYHTTFRVGGVPIIYTPYFIVPVKRTRQTGFLAPTYGYSSEDGVQFQIPFYAVLDDYSDLTTTPFIEVETRRGASLKYRRRFSRTSDLDTKLYYSDESPRDGDLRGTNVDNLFDPTFDEDRYGGYFRYGWESDTDVLVPTRLTSDIRYVGDDLFLREIEDSEIGDRSSRYVTSQMLVQSSVAGRVFAEVSGEYNQSMLTDDDLVFQRLPEINLSTRESFRPFGFNPYGIRTIAGVELNATDFVRDEGFDGWRYNISPTITIPHHFQNYMSGTIEMTMDQTFYNQSEDRIPDSDEVIEGDDRRVFQFAYTASTAVERVYQVEQGSFLSYVTGLGARSQANRLRRVKHVIEPFARYLYTPSTYQDDLPVYDSTDRIRQRSLVTYGVRTSLLGRFTPTTGTTRIEELTPELEDIPVYDPDSPVFGRNIARMARTQRGRVDEIAYLSLAQTYDYVEDRKNRDEGREAFSDIGYEMGVTPSSYFGLALNGNFDAEEQDLSSWGLGTSIRDDRGDVLRARYTYIDDQVSQLDGNLELVLSDRFKLGFFGRYDDQESEFIESEVALRIQSACNCWYVDVGYTDTINPDKQQGLVRFTLLGLGEIAQNFSLDQEDTNN